VGAYGAIGKARREDRDGVAGYLDRIATMLAEMANELETNGTSPARCAELVEAIGNLDSVLRRSSAARQARRENELLRGLTIVLDAPFGLDSLPRSEAFLVNFKYRMGRGDLGAKDLRSIREVSGMFKGAAEYIKAH
jgi:hypothetical protein